MSHPQWEQTVQFQTKYQQTNPIARFLTNRFLDTIVNLAQTLCPEGGLLLDAGCGEGINLFHINQATGGFEQFGLDISEDSVDVAREMAPQADLQVGSLYQLPFPDNHFDLVICTEVLEHLDDPDKGLCEVYRVAKEKVILSVPREPVWRMLNMARGAYLKDFGNTEGHVNHWNKNGFLNFVRTKFSQIEDHSVLPWTIVSARK